MLKYNWVKSKLAEPAKCCVRKTVKRDTRPFRKMVKNALAGPKSNHMAKNDMEICKYSLKYHAHKTARLCATKMIKETQLNFKKGIFCLAIDTEEFKMMPAVHLYLTTIYYQNEI